MSSAQGQLRDLQAASALAAYQDGCKTADLPIFPPIGPALAVLPAPDAPHTDAALPAVTDDNYVWV